MQAAPEFIDGLDIFYTRDRTRRVVVLQALADAGQRVTHLDAELAQKLGRSDPGQLQQLRRVVGAAGQYYFLVGADFGNGATLAAFDVAHADRALAVEDDLGRMRMGAHMDIRPFARGMQKRSRGADAAAVLNGTLRVGDAFLDRAVVVGVARNAEAHRTSHERLAERIAPLHGGNRQTAVAPAIGILALADAPLQPLEIRQHIRIAPAAIAELRPGVEILALAAIVDVAVNRGGAAERFSTRRINTPAPGPGTGLLLVGPVDAL